jgi:hypothetical protein
VGNSQTGIGSAKDFPIGRKARGDIGGDAERGGREDTPFLRVLRVLFDFEKHGLAEWVRVFGV